MPWSKHFVYVFKKVANPFQKLRLYIKQKLGWLDMPIILPYRGMGNAQCVWLRGQVLEDSGLANTSQKPNVWQNLLAMYKRFASDAIPGVKVQGTFRGKIVVAETDEKGFFAMRFDLDELIPEGDPWQNVELELLDEVIEDQGDIRAIGEVVVMQRESEYGIISDVDDTVLISHATNTYKKVRLMVIKNARTRLPFEGVAAFYHWLQLGMKPECFNPIFFVSSSEWNLYDLLIEFAEVNNIPKAPFLLRTLEEDWWKFWKSGGGSHNHKLDKIDRIMEAFEGMKFILIGDSGQHDTELYSRAVEQHPGRILAIYIRDVSKNKRDKAVSQIATEVCKREGVDMLLVHDTVAATKHAIEKGYIPAEALEDVKLGRLKDRQQPETITEVLKD